MVGTQSPWTDIDLYLSLSPQILDGSGHVKYCVDASKPDIGSWLKYIQFAPTAKQHNLTACQIDDQVSGDICSLSWRNADWIF